MTGKNKLTIVAEVSVTTTWLDRGMSIRHCCFESVGDNLEGCEIVRISSTMEDINPLIAEASNRPLFHASTYYMVR